MSAFVPLHVHSHYSLLKALPKIPELVAAAKAQGYTAMALTDIDNLYGAIEFYKECKAQGIKPIIGLDAKMEGGSRKLLYAADITGYKNLLALVTKSHLTDLPTGRQAHEGPLITQTMLDEHSLGLVIVDPKDKNVALPEIYYLEPEDRRAWETMRAIENRGPQDVNVAEEDEEYFFPVADAIAKKYTPEQIAQTVAIAGQCNLELELGKWVFPNFPIPAGSTYNDELRILIEEGEKTVFFLPPPRGGAGGGERKKKIFPEKGAAPFSPWGGKKKRGFLPLLQ